MERVTLASLAVALILFRCDDQLYLTNAPPPPPEAIVPAQLDSGIWPDAAEEEVPLPDGGFQDPPDAGFAPDAAAPLACMIGEMRACYTGPAATRGVGICRDGTESCVAGPGGPRWDSCLDEVLPRAEVCGNAMDDDCDGVIDQNCTCLSGQDRNCYPGPRAEIGVGICRAGRQSCLPDGTGWTPCAGAVTPAAETCGNSIDEDCDGMSDEGCACGPSTTRSCYSGPQSTRNVGPCRAGTQQCTPDGTAWLACTGEVTPAAEVCGNSADEDCNGTAERCPPVQIPLNLIGDCVTAACPAATPYPVGCNVLFSPGDPRGCVASRTTSPIVFFKAGNECDVGLVLGTLYCSDTPGAALGPQNCPINKPQPMWVTNSSQCPQ